MNVVIIGCHGLLGHKMFETAPKDVNLFGMDLQDTSESVLSDNYCQLDIIHRQDVIDTIKAVKPDWIVNAAAYTGVDRAETEKEKCWNVNVTGVENLAFAALKTRAKLVSISTDYIFDGIDGPYTENARPNALGFYARSKLAGENALHKSLAEYAIVRTMILYGYVPQVRPNFVTWLIDALEKNHPVDIVTDQLGNPTLADELAAGIWKIIEKNYLQIVNIAGRERIDRYSFACMVARVFELDESLIRPVKTVDLKQAAPRPLNSGLVVDKAVNELGLALSDAQEGLEKLKNQMNRG
ncbi:dTDP-4-dehydrorhamnose reductase [candidate division KSB1 bacterium]|nr:dTDP-4-dehydrorhamnose reductase [candidate division KSB1 bacterium]